MPNCILSPDFQGWYCTRHTDGDCSVVADSDIAGIGVLLSFGIVSLLTFVLGVMSYLGNCIDPPLLNGFDRKLLRGFCVLFRRNLPTPNFTWRLSTQRLLLAWGDQLLALGIGITIAMFANINTITIYHGHIAIYTAWLAFNGQLATLTILRVFYQRRRKRLYWRLSLSAILFVLLVVAITLTSSSKWPQNYNYDDYGTVPIFQDPNATFQYNELFTYDSSLSCSLDGESSIIFEWSSAFSLFFITTSFVSRIIKSTEKATSYAQNVIIEPLRSSTQGMIERTASRREVSKRTWKRAFHTVVLKFLLWLYIMGQSFSVLHSSFLIELCWYLGSIIWGCTEILAWRQRSPLLQWENGWSFSQLLAMILLLLPLLSLIELRSEAKDAGETYSVTDDAPSIDMRPLTSRSTDQLNEETYTHTSSSVFDNYSQSMLNYRLFWLILFLEIFFVISTTGLSLSGIIVDPVFIDRLVWFLGVAAAILVVCMIALALVGSFTSRLFKYPKVN